MAKHRRSRRHRKSFKGFSKDHPWLFFFLASSAISTAGVVIYGAITGKSLFAVNGYRPYQLNSYAPYKLQPNYGVLLDDPGRLYR
jgi:predicted Abi (CAAX) family protease